MSNSRSGPSSSIRITQLKVPSSPISSSAFSATSHVNTVCSGWSKGTPGGISSVLRRRVAVVERRRQLGLALRRRCRDVRGALAAEQRLAWAMKADVGVGPRPHGRQRAPGDQDPSDLAAAWGPCPSSATRTTPSPRRRWRRAAGIDSPRPATARTPGTRLGEHGPHAVVGLHRDDLVGPADQEPRQGAGPGAQVDDGRAPAPGRIQSTASTGGPGR